MELIEVKKSDSEVLFKRHFSVTRIKEDKLIIAENRALKVIKESSVLKILDQKCENDDECEIVVSLGIMTRKGNCLALKIKKIKVGYEYWIISIHENEVQFKIPEKEWDDGNSEFYIEFEDSLDEVLDEKKLNLAKQRALQFLNSEKEEDGLRSLENFLDEHERITISLDIPFKKVFLCFKVRKTDSGLVYTITHSGHFSKIDILNIEWADDEAYYLDEIAKKLLKKFFKK
ncbi:hypothetical protein Mevan_1636 [Methanococcus vannielii SB]|uniref:Uncharacterized protein n=1 Tax=Methanococcus vannielii (strain ATCC 35089 / DSM 1224 / JCM 13029 / OCM 148 / SB) TaxID=406327 RepID=A6USQ6_METVS|nr:hypothetical protein [Methanococcus vannielii]ABR55528.1 hypothetical protein Mevan_1636 [Methanococcus vannielii SB]